MKPNFELTPEEDLDMIERAEEIDAFGEFTDMLVAGENPDVETFLLRYPELADALREDLEFAKWFYEDVQRFKRAHPEVDMLDVLCPDLDEEMKKKIRSMRNR